MNFIYPFFVTFIMVLLSELGDKTQLLVLSFSTKGKIQNILLGVALGTFFSHGLAILFGSKLGSFDNNFFNFYLKLFTYITFLLFGIIGFLSKKQENTKKTNAKSKLLQNLAKIKLHYVLVVAISIFIGEIGDKTFLASLGLGLQYPNYKISLILGSICGMIASNSLIIFLGKFLGNKLNSNFVETLSNLIFILFGLIGILSITLASA